MELDDLDRVAAEALRRLHRPQGLGAQVRAPVSGADLRLRVPARPLLRQHRRGRDPGRAGRSSSGSFGDRTVRSGEEELFKARARETGSVKLIDIISARLDAKTDSYLATLPSLQLKDVRIEDKLVRDNERMLTGGFYAEVDLEYDAAIAQEKNGRPFAVAALRPDPALQARRARRPLRRARDASRPPSGSSFLLRSVGLEPTGMTERNRDVMLLRMVPFVENNYNLVELGPRGTGKSPPVPADLALRPPRLRRQGDGRPDVREQRQRASAGWSASTTWSASTKSPASPSTRRTASTS